VGRAEVTAGCDSLFEATIPCFLRRKPQEKVRF